MVKGTCATIRLALLFFSAFLLMIKFRQAPEGDHSFKPNFLVDGTTDTDGSIVGKIS